MLWSGGHVSLAQGLGVALQRPDQRPYKNTHLLENLELSKEYVYGRVYDSRLQLAGRDPPPLSASLARLPRWRDA